MGWGEYVLGGEHEDVGLELSFYTQGDVDSHLVPVEVGVERRANEGVELYGFTFYEDRLESLYGGSVEGGRPVEKNGVLFYNFF